MSCEELNEQMHEVMNEIYRGKQKFSDPDRLQKYIDMLNRRWPRAPITIPE